MACPECKFDEGLGVWSCSRCSSASIASHSYLPPSYFPPSYPPPIAPGSSKRRNASWWIPAAIVGMVIFASVSFLGYRFVQRHRVDWQGEGAAPKGIPIEHGNAVGPKELQGHGRLYLVPVGRQAISAQVLADYYQSKFGARITVLAHVDPKASDCVQARQQCAAEELESDMTTAYPEIAREPASVMIALTDDDIFPRELDWNFTYAWHSTRIGIVSSHRMDPGFWGYSPDQSIKLAATKQMLTKYIALMYFHLPESLDPTSVMFSPLTPDGGSDDIYQSDLHSEDSANGRLGKPFPCLHFTYSYETHKMSAEEPALSNCYLETAVSSATEEGFQTNLGNGAFTARSMDLRLNSSPAITLRRGYNTYHYPLGVSFAFGWGANHSYNTSLSSDGFEVQSFTMINHEDGTAERMKRITPGRGFIPGYTFESEEDFMYGARLTWERDHYNLLYRDGATSTFLPCVSGKTRCYWTGYHNANGGTLTFERGPGTELRKLTATDHQGISFQADEQLRTTEARATNGLNVSYEYDAAGCLEQVRRTDGQVTAYKYDAVHRMISVAVIRHKGARAETILNNEYDSEGHITKQILAGVGSYEIQYTSKKDSHFKEWKVAAPGGQSWHIEEDDDNNIYTVHSNTVRYPAVRPKGRLPRQKAV